MVGHLTDPIGVFVQRPELVETSSRLSVQEFDERRAALDAELQVVDLRNPGETEGGVIPGALLIQLPQLVRRLGELDPARPTVVYCAGGYRSSIGASTLRSAGFADVSDLLGGYNAWVLTSPGANGLTAPACATSTAG